MECPASRGPPGGRARMEGPAWSYGEPGSFPRVAKSSMGNPGSTAGSDSSVLREVVPADCAVVEASRPPYGRLARPNRIPRGCRSTPIPGPASRCPVGPTERIRRRPAVGGQRLAAGSDHLRKRPRISSQVSATAPAPVHRRPVDDRRQLPLQHPGRDRVDQRRLKQLAVGTCGSSAISLATTDAPADLLPRVAHGSARHAAFEYRLLTTPPSFRGPLLFGETSTPLDLDRTRRRTLNPANHAQAPDIGSLPIAGTNPPSHRAEETLR